MKNSKELFNKIALNPQNYQTRDGKKINNNIAGLQMSFHPQFEFPICLPIVYQNGKTRQQITLTDEGNLIM